jgi:hypothetical protein
VDVKPSCGLTAELVEATIEASIDHTEDDYRAAQVALARVEADGILAAVEQSETQRCLAELNGRKVPEHYCGDQPATVGLSRWPI